MRSSIISSIVGSVRGTPDFSFDGDPYSGVAVFEDSPACTGSNAGWMVFGGTSVATPALAGIVNLAGKNQATGSSSRYAEQTQMYTGYNAAGYYGVDFRDITSGKSQIAAYAGGKIPACFRGITSICGPSCTGWQHFTWTGPCPSKLDAPRIVSQNC